MLANLYYFFLQIRYGNAKIIFVYLWKQGIFMFDFLDGLREDRQYDRHKVKAVIDRLNMGRLYTFSLAGCVGMLFFALLFSLVGLHLLPGKYQTLAFLSLAAIFILFFLMIYITVKTKNTAFFEKLVYSYIAVITVVMFVFSFRAESVLVAMVFYMLLMVFLSLVPVLSPVVSLILWGAQFIAMAVFALVKQLDITTSTSFILIGIMGLMLSVFSYSGFLRKLNYKLSLDHAISEAETDPMTSLLNRRGLDHRLESIWPHCIRQQTRVAVVMVDIDNFKKYNDSFGHAAGDGCIKAVTGAIRNCVRRRTDYGARVGGEEFLVFLSDIDPAQAVRWVLNLQKSILALKIPHSKMNFSPYVTVSLGLATAVVNENITFDALKEEADMQLYASKNNGRDRLYYRNKCYRSDKNNRTPADTDVLEEAN